MGSEISLWTIIPVRGVRAGKSRLADVLGAADREALNTRLLVQALGALEDLERCLVVSPCTETLALAREHGAATLRETGGDDPLNAALEQARVVLAGRGAERVVVLHADLPLVDADAVRTLHQLATPPGRVLIAPDHAESGTNALAVDIASAYRFRFGEASFARHVAQAEALGLPVFVHRDPALAFDLDTPADFRRWHGDPAHGMERSLG